MALIDEMSVINGRMLKENGAPLNIADVLSNAINVSSISGEPASNFTRPDNTTTYSIGDVVGSSPSANMVFSDVSSVDGSHVIIMGVSLRIDVSAIPEGMSEFRLHLYNTAPTPIADNDAYNLIAADRSKYLGCITLDAPIDLGDTLYSDTKNVNLKIKLATGSTSLYGVLQTLNAYTPTSQAAKTVKLHVVGV